MKCSAKLKLEAKKRRAIKVRAKIKQNCSSYPRLSIFRSLKHIYAQIIDQKSGKIVVSASDIKIKKGNKTAKAKEVGMEIGKKLLEQKIKEVTFDRGAYKYHGRVKALAEGAREAGVKF